MSKRTIDKYRSGPGRARIVRKPTPQIIPGGNEGPGKLDEASPQVAGSGSGNEAKVAGSGSGNETNVAGGGTGEPEAFDAEVALTDLGEQEVAAESENEDADLETVNEVPPKPVDPRFPDEAAPLNHGGGSID